MRSDVPAKSQQLSMDLANTDTFALRRRGGEFSLLLELDCPADNQPFAAATAIAVGMARMLHGTSITALALTDRRRQQHTHDPIEVAAVLAAAAQQPPLLHIAGKSVSRKQIRELLARARSIGIRSVLALTGDRAHSHVEGRAGQQRGDNPGYLDALTILELCRDRADIDAGAAVNCFKYNPADLYLQMFKMVRKLHTGAQFLLTPVGWDMKKFQELQWYLQMRELGVPVIARVALLSPSDIDTLHLGYQPGAAVSRGFMAMLQRESQINAQQSLSAQLQRLGLQVAGCRLLGYSGVQLVGIHDERTLEMVLGQVDSAMARYQSYADWVAAWNEFHNFLDFAPVPNAYYIYKNLLDPAQQHYDSDCCICNDRSLPLVGNHDKLRYYSNQLLAAHKTTAAIAAKWQQLRYRQCRAQQCGCQTYTFGLCPAPCPKKLMYGPCGGAAVDGICEFGAQTCFFHRVLAVAVWRQQLDALETGL